jgi:hypothetical protein
MPNFLWLRIGLVLGALVDLAGAISLRCFPWFTAHKLGLPMPSSLPVLDFWARYASVFLFVLPLFYFLTALKPTRYRGNVVVAACARTLGFFFYGTYYFQSPRDHWFLWLALMNILFAGWYAWELRRTGLLANNTVALTT